MHSDETISQVHDIIAFNDDLAAHNWKKIGPSNELYDTIGHYDDFNKSDEIIGHSDGKAGHCVHNRTL